MTSREEAERLLKSIGEDDIVEIDEEGRPRQTGTSMAAPREKPVAGISDSKGEYSRLFPGWSA
ncbi:hypothetical protein [Phytohabitans kaempferiae]|uniref:Uncharacterized protein n=1 Tax=Phytohabitans kaempferiae TaxID=1620943 RepID=A0ABV6MFD0_9ACTN